MKACSIYPQTEPYHAVLITLSIN